MLSGSSVLKTNSMTYKCITNNQENSTLDSEDYDSTIKGWNHIMFSKFSSRRKCIKYLFFANGIFYRETTIIKSIEIPIENIVDFPVSDHKECNGWRYAVIHWESFSFLWCNDWLRKHNNFIATQVRSDFRWAGSRRTKLIHCIFLKWPLHIYLLVIITIERHDKKIRNPLCKTDL